MAVVSIQLKLKFETNNLPEAFVLPEDVKMHILSCDEEETIIEFSRRLKRSDENAADEVENARLEMLELAKQFESCSTIMHYY